MNSMDGIKVPKIGATTQEIADYLDAVQRSMSPSGTISVASGSTKPWVRSTLPPGGIPAPMPAPPRSSVHITKETADRLLNGESFPGVFIGPPHKDPVELSVAWLRSNACDCETCISLRLQLKVNPEMRPRDKPIHEMTHLDYAKCMDAFWKNRGRYD